MALETIWNDIGPCELTYKSNVLGATVANPEGGTHGGAIFRLTTETAESYRDKEGSNPHDSTVRGTMAEIEANLTGMAVDQLAVLVPGSSLSSGSTSKRLDIKGGAGYSLRDNAGVLYLKPIINGVATTDETQWIKVSLAHPKPGPIELAFDMETQRVYKVIFMAFPDSSGVIAQIGKDVT